MFLGLFFCFFSAWRRRRSRGEANSSCLSREARPECQRPRVFQHVAGYSLISRQGRGDDRLGLSAAEPDTRTRVVYKGRRWNVSTSRINGLRTNGSRWVPDSLLRFYRTQWGKQSFEVFLSVGPGWPSFKNTLSNHFILFLKEKKKNTVQFRLKVFLSGFACVYQAKLICWV